MDYTEFKESGFYKIILTECPDALQYAHIIKLIYGAAKHWNYDPETKELTCKGEPFFEMYMGFNVTDRDWADEILNVWTSCPELTEGRALSLLKALQVLNVARWLLGYERDKEEADRRRAELVNL